MIFTVKKKELFKNGISLVRMKESKKLEFFIKNQRILNHEFFGERAVIILRFVEF